MDLFGGLGFIILPQLVCHSTPILATGPQFGCLLYSAQDQPIIGGTESFSLRQRRISPLFGSKVSQTMA